MVQSFRRRCRWRAPAFAAFEGTGNFGRLFQSDIRGAVESSLRRHRFQAHRPGIWQQRRVRGVNARIAKKRNRTVLDFVFNHTAIDFAPFLDIREKGESSAYKDWFFIKSYPVKVADPPNYVAWFNYPSMPKLNLMNPQTGSYMLDLVNFWKKEIPLAGLRLDVADEVDVRFWRQLRTRTKRFRPANVDRRRTLV
jgi:hypothetical protein